MKRIINSIGNETKIFADTFEYEAYDQVKALANFAPYLNAKIRVMPDGHVGKGCTVGTTMTITDKITPNLVGVDIGCGMLTTKLHEKEINLPELDRVIKKEVPSGFAIRGEAVAKFDFSDLRCAKHADLGRALLSIGTLGGGNHFIEVNKGEDNSLYLVIHSGSRHLGVNVWKYYQDLAWKNVNEVSTIRKERIDDLKKQGRKKEIETELKKLRKPPASKDLAYLEGSDFDDYLNDMQIVQRFASRNRETMANVILAEMGLTIAHQFETVHNYIDIRHKILRKGAVSAHKGEILLIPVNMRDGSLICRGKGNEDWNYSAPHGAGRLMSRSKAKELLSMDEYEESMRGIYSSTVSQSTLDEAPQAYKPMEEIMSAIADTVDVIEVIKPIYNFKAQ
ncbi:RtcB family protein [uncultured Proteiniphilum sp.]|uniref:RtcB family protein n=1 Tax=uncultured Proteiniphilum sp. TaxID=497637 RepID=UPI002610760C|nr:RtcB family protein [uncultured Proteiniphilum sp.]